MAESSTSVSNLVDHLSRLPGIGRKSAERIAYHLLRVSKGEALSLSEAIRAVRENVCYCGICYNLAESNRSSDASNPHASRETPASYNAALCSICRDVSRDQTRLCVVEQPQDLMALEQASVFRGLYHVLLGRIAPLEGIGPDNLTIDALIERVRRSNFVEIIMATNPTVEGDGSALYITNLLSEFPVEVTRLARGITSGSILEHTNKEILADAITGRQKL
jgi:recombination protein RecR